MKKSYVYADGQILAQYDGDPAANPPPDIYFYLHDRLGSVRQVIDAAAAVVNHYTYEPYGQTIDAAETVPNPWRFTGQYYDAEIQEYHLRARQYNPFLARFTARDPIFGKFAGPLTLHKYLYCTNDPLNQTDIRGATFTALVDPVITGHVLREHGITLATYAAASEDWRYFDLADVTFRTIPGAMVLAGLNPLGPKVRLGVWFVEGVTEAAWDSITGMTPLEALAVDVWAYAFYAVNMYRAEDQLGVSGADMAEFIKWKWRIFQME